MNKTSAFLLAVVILVQFAVIAALIRGKERILREGDVFLFKTLPIDPSDPFQGRYVQLRFEANRISGKNGQDSGLSYKEPLYALIETGADGFAFFSGWRRDKPASGAFLRTRYLGDQGEWDQAGRRSAQKAIRISLPFDRYYMNEAKAPQAEKAVWETTRGTNCWASVRILQGKAVVEDVFVRGRPLRDLAAQRDKEQP